MRIVVIIVLFCPVLLAGNTCTDANGLIDYVSIYNIESRPKDYRPENNAAEYYQKAISLFVEAPDEIRNENLKVWPADLPDEKAQIIKQWIKRNDPALAHLSASAEKPFLWMERTSSDGSVLGILMPELAKMRNLADLLCYKAKLAAIEG